MFSTEEKTHTDFISQNWEFISHSCDFFTLRVSIVRQKLANVWKYRSFFPLRCGFINSQFQVIISQFLIKKNSKKNLIKIKFRVYILKFWLYQNCDFIFHDSEEWSENSGENTIWVKVSLYLTVLTLFLRITWYNLTIISDKAQF